MRTHLLVPLLSLIPALTAQAPSPRAAAQPMQPANEVATSAQGDLTPTEREAMSRALGSGPRSRVLFDRPESDGPIWACGNEWKASFDATGFTTIPFFGSLAPRNFPVRFELDHATVGGTPIALADGEPVVSGNRIRTSRGDCTEVIDTDLDRIEQSFVFDTLPHRGAITVDIRVTTELAVSTLDDGIRFGNEFGHFDYRKAVAVDAAGQRLPLAIEWTGTGVHMEIPASFVERAKLPLVLDPILNGWIGLAGGLPGLQLETDVASFQALGGRTLIVYRRDYSANDTDCYGIMFDGNLGLVQTDFAIDFTSANYKNAAVASHNYSQNFLVVAEVETVVDWFIVGRGVSASGVAGLQFNIERNGVVGLPGNNYAPDVGSDPYSGPGNYTVVFAKQPNIFSPKTMICYKQVTPAGGLATTNPIVVETWAQGVGNPSISKSCGQSNGQPAFWLLTWERTYSSSPLDRDIYGRFVNWNGAIQGIQNFAIGTLFDDELGTSSSSPIDIAGVRYWPTAHVIDTPAPSPVMIKILNSNGGIVAASTQFNDPALWHANPEIDSDGTRFVVASEEQGFIRISTGAYLAGSSSLRVDNATVVQGYFLRPNICADYSGGNLMSPRYFVSYRAYVPSSNTAEFQLQNYGGWSGNAPFFPTATNSCSANTMAVTGSPVIGQTVAFDVQPGPLALVSIGTPTNVNLSLMGCFCDLGVDAIATYVSPWSWQIPNNPAFVGLQFAAQGFHVSSAGCFGVLNIGRSVHFTIR